MYEPVRVKPDTDITKIDFITKQIQLALTRNLRFLNLKEYYISRNTAIKIAPPKPKSKPDYRINNGFASYITDVNVGYFIGIPVKYQPEAGMKEFKDALQDIFDYNDEQDENAQLVKDMSIKGITYEILYIDDDARARFNIVNPENIIVIYDNAITPNMLGAIRFEILEDERVVEVYTQDEVLYFEGGETALTLVDRQPHYWGQVPVIEFLNNEEGIGDFEKEIDLIDAYNKMQSDGLNDFEYFADAFLALTNMSGTQGEDIDRLRRDRVMLLDEGGKAEWVIKHIPDAAIENYKNRLQMDIHRFSMTPNLTDDSFAQNLSGVAAEFKLWGLEQLAVQKERKFKRGLQKRIELLCNYMALKNGAVYDWRDMEMTFTRNIPTNILETVNMATSLAGIVSTETMLSVIPFINDPAREMERIEAEKNAYVDLNNYYEEPEEEIKEEIEDEING